MPEESIRIMCPNLLCRKVLGVPATARGKTVRCKACSTTIRIPDKPANAPKPEIQPEPETEQSREKAT
jgi:hypothetical protein